MKKKAKAVIPENRKKRGFQPGKSGNPATQFQPGQSGNPGGRPKSKPLTEAIERILKANPLEADKIAKAMLKKLRGGSVLHFKEIADRIEGKVVQQAELTGPGGDKLEMTVNVIAGRAPAEN
jgi:hypothetical protein